MPSKERNGHVNTVTRRVHMPSKEVRYNDYCRKKAPKKIGHSFPLQKGHTQRGQEGGGPSKPLLSVKRRIPLAPRSPSHHELPWWRPEGAPPRWEAFGPSLGV